MTRYLISKVERFVMNFRKNPRMRKSSLNFRVNPNTKRRKEEFKNIWRIFIIFNFRATWIRYWNTNNIVWKNCHYVWRIIWSIIIQTNFWRIIIENIIWIIIISSVHSNIQKLYSVTWNEIWRNFKFITKIRLRCFQRSIQILMKRVS